MKHPVQRTLYYVTTILLSLVFITPMWMVLVNALKEKKDARFFSLALPEVPVWENFTTVIEMGGVFRAFFNGLIVSTGSVIIVLLFSALAAFPIARSAARWSKGAYYLFTMLGTWLTWFQPEVRSPDIFGVMLVLILLLALLRSADDGMTLPSPVRALCVGVFVVGSLAAMASMLLGWTFNTEQIIQGVQGRYFLPYLPLLLLGLRPRRVEIGANTLAPVIGLMSVAHVLMLTRTFSIVLTLF